MSGHSRNVLIAIGALICAGLPAAAATQAEVELGRQLAVETCGACHAIGAADASPLADTPAFRDLGKRYPLADLEEALAEGIVTGHDAMPQVEWETAQIIAFIAYLETIQAR